jgi:AGCS family alanine or glycine:cation symporter
MTKFLDSVNSFVWGVPALVLILGVGLYLSLRTGFSQITLFPKALRLFLSRFRKRHSDGISPFRALCTALAATVGTGNIAGVAGAIAIGGPGAVFWMWISALLGMMTKFAEATLAVRFREKHGAEFSGGPMYMIKNGLPKGFSWLAVTYCVLGLSACFGVGNLTQINAVVAGANDVMRFFGMNAGRFSDLLLGFLLAVILTPMLMGGAKRIGAVAELLVPFAAAGYLILCGTVLVLRWQAIPGAFHDIVFGAFSPRAVTGGAIGSVFQTLRVGVCRGVFTNEAGMGTAGIAHGCADVEHPAQQGLMGIMEVFLDTIVICTMTALVILCSGIPVVYGNDEGANLTIRAFSSVCGDWVCVPITLFLCCFAFATILGWGLYGARCAQFLFGDGGSHRFAFLQGGTVILGAVLNTGTVWLLAETLNGLMSIPNLIALVGLSNELVRLTKEYKSRPGRKSAIGGTYENFNQRKPLRTFSYAEVSSTCRQRTEAGQEDLPLKHRTA